MNVPAQSHRAPEPIVAAPSSGPSAAGMDHGNAAAIEDLALAQAEPGVTWPPPEQQSWWEEAIQWGGDTFLDGAEGLAELMDDAESGWDAFWDDPWGTKRAAEDRRLQEEATEKYGPPPPLAPRVSPPQPPPPPPTE